jgi:hypothetical protein
MKTNSYNNTIIWPIYWLFSAFMSAPSLATVLIPNEVKALNAIDLGKWFILNGGTIVAAAIVIISLIMGANHLLNELKEYNKTRDTKALLASLFSVLLVVVTAGLCGYLADVYINNKFGAPG